MIDAFIILLMAAIVCLFVVLIYMHILTKELMPPIFQVVDYIMFMSLSMTFVVLLVLLRS